MQLFDKAKSVKIVLFEETKEAILIAALDLQRNLRQLSGQKVGFPIYDGMLSKPVESDSAINGNFVKEMLETDSSGIYIHTGGVGEPESYEVCIEEEKVQITGSDTLGTIYGIYAFATQILNILPTYRLHDVFPKQRESLSIESQIFHSKERKVRFRGWFLNDEDLLSEYKIGGGKRHMDYPYYQNVMATDVLDMVLETALRLEINLIIPASFLNIDNPDEEALVKATCRRGLYVSQHHIEPMGVSYFTADSYIQTYGKEGEDVSFISNRSRMEEIWRYYAKKWATYGKQVVWQLGLRGKGDTAVWETDSKAPMSMKERGQIISDAIQTQHDIIREILGTGDFYSTSTLWNEGSGLYEEGYLQFPKDTILVFADFGTDQMFGKDLYLPMQEKNRNCGVYYHAAYWTLGPHFTEGCNPKKMAFNYREAAKQEKLYYSILNVSNVRPFHFSVTMNAKILEEPIGIDVESAVEDFDRAIFQDMASAVSKLRWEYYDSFADFTTDAIIAKAKKLHFSYRSYDDIEFLRNAATDGQMAWYGRKTLSGKVHTDRPAPKEDILGMKESAEKFKALYQKMEEVEKQLPKESMQYFRQFLKYQTLHMQLLTEWSIACEALTDDMLTWQERKKQGVYGYQCLKRLLEERKILEEGEWANWHRGDRKIELSMCLERTRNYILQQEALF